MKTVFKGPVFSVESGTLREPGGVKGRRDLVRHSGSVAILPIASDLSIILIRQYRCAFKKMVIELPAGRVDKGESPLQAAKRELSEEVGLGAKKWRRLMRILPTPGFCDETVTLYRASGLFPSFAEPDPDERIEVMSIPLAQALKCLGRGQIEDAKTAVALLLEAALTSRE